MQPDNIYNCDKAGSTQSTDWAGPGWYRVVDPAGTRLAESVDGLDVDHCGTDGGGWLKNGTHDSLTFVGQVVDAKVCFPGWGYKCATTTKIKIKKCHEMIGSKEFFLYWLPAVTSCINGYCTE